MPNAIDSTATRAGFFEHHQRETSNDSELDEKDFKEMFKSREKFCHAALFLLKYL
jgi:hypothetical protein